MKEEKEKQEKAALQHEQAKCKAKTKTVRRVARSHAIWF